MAPKLAIPKSRADPQTDSSDTRSRWRFSRRLRLIFHLLAFYFQHPACLPSFTLALLYLTVLFFSGQMVTYLLSAGFNSSYIALVRSLSVIIELTATWLAPWIIKRITPTRGGSWFLNWQILWLVATVSFFWSEKTAIVAASGLAAGTILSRVGLWGYDLCAQVIIQSVGFPKSIGKSADLIRTTGGARRLPWLILEHRKCFPERL
jgi:iron-regulated transporter 1